MMRKLPLFYFPPTICWVDDNQLFLSAASNLFKEDYPCLAFSKPEEAIQFLAKYQSPHLKINFMHEVVGSDIFDAHNHLGFDVNISEIIKLADDQSIRNEIGVLIIDNNMPNISGIQLCHQFQNAPYKKMLLTGEASPVEVIDAFNEGVIDKFVTKQQNFTDSLQNNILELSYKFFYEKTKNLLAHLEVSTPSPVSDPIFVDFFHHWREINQFNEFYLINRYGSFLLKNKRGNSAYLVVMSENAKNEFLSSYAEEAEEINDLVSQLLSGQVIPFFGVGREPWEFEYADWNKYFYPAQVLQGREKYYWTTINKEM